MSSTYDHIKGKIIQQVGLTAQEGQADRVASLLKAIKDFSTTDQEPGCLTFRVLRSGNEFSIFEEYASADAVQAHLEVENFKKFFAEVSSGSLVVGGPRVAYYEEI